MSDPIAPAAPQSAASRLAFLVLGLMTLGVGLIITIGAAIAGLLAIALAGYASSRRGRNLTRRKAWLVSVGATVGLLFIVLSTAILTDDSNTRPQTAEERAEARSKVEQEMPEWMRAMRPNAGQQAAAADSMADRLLQNRAIVILGGTHGSGDRLDDDGNHRRNVRMGGGDAVLPRDARPMDDIRRRSRLSSGLTPRLPTGRNHRP